MDFKVVQTFIKETLKVRGLKISDRQLLAVEAAWTGITYKEIAERENVSSMMLQTHDGPELWRTLSQIFGERVTKPRFREICTRIIEKQGIEPFDSQKEDKIILGASLPLSEHFVGREREMKQVRWLIENYKLTLLIGAEGIGKRSLIAEIVNAWDFPISRIIWKPLHHHPSAQELETELKALLKLKRPQNLIEFLKKDAHLIVFESLDATLVQKKASRNLDPKYLSLIRRICEESAARIIAMAKEPIPEIKALELRGQAVLHTLQGLRPNEAKLMVSNKLVNIRIPEICQAVGGNPLMLKTLDQWLRETGTCLGSTIVNRTTVQASVVDDIYQALIHDQRLSTIDKQLLATIAKDEKGITFSDLLTAHPNAASGVQRLLDMGIVKKHAGYGSDAIMHMDALFRQFILMQTPNLPMSA